MRQYQKGRNKLFAGLFAVVFLINLLTVGRQTLWASQDGTAQEETAQEETVQDGTVQEETVQNGTVQEETAQEETVQDGTVQEETAQTETVRVAVIDYPNFFQISEDGQVSGYVYEYLQKIQKDTGWQYEYVEMSLAEASDALQNGEVDLMAGNQYTENRAALWDYSKRDMGDGGSVLCVLPESKAYCFNDFSSYDGLRIGALKGTIRIEQTREKLAQYGAEAVFTEYDTDEESKQALENGEVDAILMSNIRCEAAYKILARIDTVPIYFCTNKQKPSLKAELDAAMENIHLNLPYYEATLYQKYYGDISIQTAYTAAEQAYIAAAGEIVVAISPDLAPVEYYDEKTDTYSGIVVDSFKLFSEYSGLKFRFTVRSDMDTVRSQMESGDIQAVGSVVDNPAVAAMWGVELTDTYYNNNITMVANDKVQDYTNDNCRVVLRTGYPFLEQIARTAGYTNIEYVDSFTECVEAVNSWKADVSLIPSNCVDMLVHKDYYTQLDTYIMPDSSSEFAIGIAASADPLLVSILDKAIASFTIEQQTEILIRNLKTMDAPVTLRTFITDHRWQVITGILIFSILLTLGAGYLAVSRSRMNKQLRVAAIQADAANRAKSDFLARMSHDMRTPMNGILGLTYLMEEQTEKETVHRYIMQLRESGAYLLQLINDVLDVNKVESGAIELNPKVCDEELLFESVIALVQPQMAQKSIDFHFEKNNITWKLMILDEQRVKQIFVNLLSNAVKFTPEGGRIDFIMSLHSQTEDKIRDKFVIRDTGIGIMEDFLPRIFDPFVQENRNGSDISSGTGLGLTIVKHLVELMGGNIGVKSKVNEGTEFTVYLDFPLAVEIDKMSLDKNGETDAEGMKTEISDAEVPENKKGKAVDSLVGIHILLCEDHPLNAQIAIRLLEKKGADVTWAENGRIGVNIFEEEPVGTFDVILMDIRMPVMNGLETTAYIRGMHRADADIPIIAMTANAFAEDVEASHLAGINAYLTKPVEPEILYAVIMEWADKK